MDQKEETKSQSVPSEPLYREAHLKYLYSFEKSKDLSGIGSALTEHLRIAGAYWTITGLICLRGKIPEEKKKELVKWIKSCQNPDGGFGGNTGHDSHITATHYALLMLIQFDALSEVDMDGLADYIASLQEEDGSFKGDIWGEVDTRFSYCALSSLTLLDKRDKINIDKACEYILTCRNLDGCYGGFPEAESHSAFAFCGIGTLAIAGRLDLIDKESLGTWLIERQTPKGGFSGRPEKLPDVCYSWWIYSTLKMIHKDEFIDEKALEAFILECQDIDGGICDRKSKGGGVDVFHTFFGLAALSLLDKTGERNLEPINPKFAIPEAILREKFPHVKLCIIYLSKPNSLDMNNSGV